MLLYVTLRILIRILFTLLISCEHTAIFEQCQVQDVCVTLFSDGFGVSGRRARICLAQ